MRLPKHIGIIPDGNRRWAQAKGLSKDKGYANGIGPGTKLLKLCQKIGIEEVTFYGFTVDNTKRPKNQRRAFTKACITAVKALAKEAASVLVLGNTRSPMFPKELIPFTTRKEEKGKIKVNLLVNYGWEWDLGNLKNASPKTIMSGIKSSKISRIDLIIRWGGRRRLSGFLPVQSVYSDFYIVEDLWPDFKPRHFLDALNWYNKQDVTLGG